MKRKNILRCLAAILVCFSFSSCGLYECYINTLTDLALYTHRLSYNRMLEHLQRESTINSFNQYWTTLKNLFFSSEDSDIAEIPDKNKFQLEQETDFIESFTPYAIVNQGGSSYYHCVHVKHADNKTWELGSNHYTHYIAVGNLSGSAIYYDLGGNYKKLTLEMFSASNSTIEFYGDNEKLLETVTITGNNLPSSHTINVTGVHQFIITMRESNVNSHHTYILDAVIK